MERTFKTKLSATSPSSVETKAVIDFTGVTREELEKLASATVVINQQAIYRTSGTIPKVDTIKVREQLDAPRVAFKPTVENMHARAQTMSPEDKAKLLKALQDSMKADKK